MSSTLSENIIAIRSNFEARFLFFQMIFERLSNPEMIEALKEERVDSFDIVSGDHDELYKRLSKRKSPVHNIIARETY